MPEIKNQFTGGKMNKDVDERLVPKGEYRDAMNIQVSTSEGSDVGTVQNILGNSQIQHPALLHYNNHECIGSISDEKNDAFYWLLAEKTWEDQMLTYSTISSDQIVHTNSSPLLDIMITNFAAFENNPLWIKESKSIILQHKNDNINVVFVDKASVIVTAWQGSGTGSGGQSQHDMAYNDYVSGDTPTVSSGFSSWGTGGGGYTNTTSYQLEVYDVSNIHPGMTVKGLGLDPYYYKLTNYWENAVVISIEEVGTWVDSFGKTRVQGIVQLNINTGGFSCVEPPVNFQEFGFIQPSAWQQSGPLGICGYKNLGQWIPNQMVVTHWVFETQTLDLDIKYPVTGINIVDDLLLWTDNNSEPKCININDSISGTDQSGLFHTNMLVEDRKINPNSGIFFPARQKHVTTIKSPPKNAPMLQVGVSRGGNSNGLIYGLDLQGEGVGNSITGITIVSPFEDGLNYQVGDSLALKNIDSYNNITSPSEYYPITAADAELVLVITDIESQDLVGMYGVTCSIVNFSLAGAQTGTLDYACNWLDDGKPLYRLKFPRFATRYKYKDGQYSSFSPFSEIAFQPGNYSFNASVGYNPGMENVISSLTLLNIITPDIPEDVVAIDILYKESNSPNVYVIDTVVDIPPTLLADPTSKIFSQLTDDYGYIITAESISYTLSSNQLLRSYDNVPRKALAQDVTGNRVVYANYLQNYSIDKNKISFKTWITPYESTGESKSLKSLRDYDIGIMFSDKYGRETPVITSSSSKITIDKERASENNRFNVSWKLTDGYQLPSWVDSYKFYIKETSSDYYNLAMDRFYDADDGNIWLSFPSSDRNKVDEDTYLILKKEQGSNQLAKNDYRYKILDISNEAPDYIKVEKQKVAKYAQGTNSFNATNYNRGSLSITDVDSNGDGGLFMDVDNYNPKVYGGDVLTNGLPGHDKLHLRGKTHHDNAPVIGRLKLRQLISKDHEVEIRLSTINPEGTSDTKAGKYATKWYKLQDVTYYSKSGLYENDNGVGQFRDSEFTFHLGENFGNDTEFFFTDQSGTVTTPNTNGAPVLEIRKLIPRENKAEFNGRFFVKILKDISFYEQVLANTGTEQLVSSLNHDFGYVKDYSQEDIGGLTAIETKSNFYDAMAGTTPTLADIMTQISALPHAWAAARYTGGGTMDGVSIPTKSYYHPKTWGYILRKTQASNANGWFIDEAFAAAVDGIDGLSISAEWGEDGIQSRTDILERNQQSLFGGWNSASAPQITLDYNEGVDTDLETLYNFPYYRNRLTKLTGCIPSDQTFGQNFPGECGNNNYPTIDVPLLNHGSNLGAYQYFHLGNGTGANTGRYNRLDLSFIGGIHNQWKTEGKLQPGTYLNFFDHLHVRYGLEDDYHELIGQLTVGNKFKFADDPTEEVFTILDISVSLKNNYSEGYYDDTYPGATDLSGYQSNYPHSASTSVSHSSDYTDNANHRITWSLKLDKNIGDSGFTPTIGSATGIPGYTGVWNTPGINTNLSRIIFLEARVVFNGFGVDSTIDPSIWETEPKEFTDLDVYYEASRSYQISISKENALTTIPVGSVVGSTTSTATVDPGTIVVDWQDRQIGPNIVVVTNKPLTYSNGYNLMFTLRDGSEVQVEYWTSASTATYPDADPSNPLNTSGSLDYYQYYVKPFLLGLPKGLSWSNCYSFNNGVESNRIRDDFNAVKIDNGVAVSTTLDEPYEEERRKYGLIYSGIYNSTSGINNLNQFIAAEKITKDINPIHGSIQKLKAGWGQGGDLVALCEDRVLKILANKDALFNADGNSNVTSTNNVLGQAIPYSGEYGISKNPESFASEAYRIYFTDKVRGSVMRLSMDGLTPISSHGMKDWFRDNLKLSDKLIGSYDDKKDEYNITIKGGIIAKTVTFREDVKGWVSFKSFMPENAISCANEYYTFLNGGIWKHHDESVGRNNFYNTFSESNYSTLNVILNDLPGSVKSFNTINYEGSQSRVVPNLNDNEYYNLIAKPGWYVDSIFTNKESGSLEEFIEKEGKWFNYIRGKEVQHIFDGQNDLTRILMDSNDSSSFDQASFAIQGLGILGSEPTDSGIFGCTDPTMFNYNSNATLSDGSCIPVVLGCTEGSAHNTCNNGCNTDDSSCEWHGCTCNSTLYPNGCTNTSPFTEYWAFVNGGGSAWLVDDLSCIGAVNGCTNPNANNYDSLATVDDGSCTYDIYGCTFASSVANYDSNATVDSGTCIWYGCLDPDADNFNTNFHVDSNGYQPLDSSYGQQNQVSTCVFSITLGCTDSSATNYDPLATTDDGSCEYCDWYPLNSQPDGSHIYTALITDQSQPSVNDGEIYITWPTIPHGTPATLDLLDSSGNWVATNAIVSSATASAFQNLAPGDYYVRVTSSTFTTPSGPTSCLWDGYLEGGQMHTVGAAPVGIPGCTDATACNYCSNCVSDPSMCIQPGCDDIQSTTYDPLATMGCPTNADPTGPCVSGSQACCTYTPQPIQGCTDDGSGGGPYTGIAACNYNPLATSDDGSCNYTSCAGCLDNRLNNAQTGIAASNYDSTKTIHNQSQCVYNYGTVVYDGNTGGNNTTNFIPESMSTILSGPLASNNFLGNDSTSPNWTDKLVGSKTFVAAVFDVSNAPPIRFPGYNAGGVYSPSQTSTRETQFSWNMPGYTSDWPNGVAGDITTYYGFSTTSPVLSWEYSNDNGATWSSGSNWNYGDTVKLVKFFLTTSVDESSGVLDWDTYPYGYDGKIYQNAKFGFTDFVWNGNPIPLNDDGACASNNSCPDFHVIETSESKTIITGCTQAGYCNTSGTYGFTSNANWPTDATNNPCGGTPGCNIPAACNYNQNTDCNDGSCTSPTTWYYHSSNWTCGGSAPASGCFGVNTCQANGTCRGTAYISPSHCDNANCVGLVGCTDPTACNYNSAAVCDDGTHCLPSIQCPNQQISGTGYNCESGGLGCYQPTACGFIPGTTTYVGCGTYTGANALTNCNNNCTSSPL